MSNPHKIQRGRYFAWRAAHAYQGQQFQVLVGQRWMGTGLGGISALVVALVLVPGRRIKTVAGVLVVTLSSGLFMLGSGVWNALFPVLKRVELPVRGLPPGLDGITLAHVSDMHVGMPFTRAAVQRGLRAIQQAKPEVILFTGDFISYTRSLPDLPSLLAPLRAPAGIFACVGNHDHWAGLEQVAQVLVTCGVQLLINEHRTLQLREAQLVIAGVDDLWDGVPDLERALAGAPPDVPVVLLAHSPDYADLAAQGPLMLQLAGHSHGGHIRLPWLGPLLLPRHGIHHDRGLHRLGNMWLYVSHGLGGWPYRLGCRAEVTLLTLRRDFSENTVPGRSDGRNTDWFKAHRVT